MKLNQLRDVVAIGEQGSIRAAARKLQIGQPALTRSLADVNGGQNPRKFGADNRALPSSGWLFALQ